MVVVALFVMAITFAESTRDRGSPTISLLNTVTVEYPIKCGLIFALRALGLREQGEEYKSRVVSRKAEVLKAEAASIYGSEVARSKTQAFVTVLEKQFERVHQADFIFEMVGACEGYYGDRPHSVQ